MTATAKPGRVRPDERTERQQRADQKRRADIVREQASYPRGWPIGEPRESPDPHLPRRADHLWGMPVIGLPACMDPGPLVYVRTRQHMPTRRDHHPDGDDVWRLARLLDGRAHAARVQIFETGEVFNDAPLSACRLVLRY